MVFPQTEIGADRGAIRTYAQRVEELGFTHVLAYDHVLGADPEVHKPWNGPYDVDTTFHEPFVLFGYVAAITNIELVTGIIILPQRQTALVAKQMAEVDILARGQTRLGVAVGWNDVEYEALGMDFHTRGRRLEEQVGLLRRLWTEPVVTFEGEFDRMRAVAINPPPVQRPIPIWFGGSIERTYWRAAVLGDGLVARWPLPERPLESEWPARLEQMRAWRREAGLDGEIGLEARVFADLASSPEEWRRTTLEWKELGASHLSIRTIRLGLASADAHLERLALAKDALGEMMAA